MNLMYWLRHPKQGLARTQYWMWERMNPTKPWLCPGTVRFLDQYLTCDMTGLEFGSGRSTGWFAGKLGHLVSIEHHMGWYETVRADLIARNLVNVDYRLVPLDHAESEGERSEYDPLPQYVAAADHFRDDSLGFVLVDGHYRTHCIRRTVPKVRPGGLLVVDDLNLWPSRAAIPVPDAWPMVDLSTNGIKQTGIWRKPE